MNASELRLTDTNSADDSQGSVWGLAGDLFWIVLIGATLSVLCLLVLFSGLALPLASALALSALPLAGALGYVIFKQTHPPGYDLDLIDWWLNGPGFAPVRSGIRDGNEDPFLGESMTQSH